MTKDEIRELISQMTLEEKASLCSGGDFWHTKKVERLNIPDVMVSDGPHGLRKQKDEADHLGVNESIKAICFPAGCALASSFDRDLLYKTGEALGTSCQAENVGVILGPAVNIKRSPLCGRNFEYYSEDPYLAGEIAASYIKGVQSKNVGVSIKHFAGNSQETRRMSSDSVIDERTLREIYLSTFEKAVKESKPWTVMCSYNKLNGTYASENKELLTDILRDEWGFDGLVMSDWGAVNDRVKGVAAGLDLEMPPSHGITDKIVLDAVKEGKLDEALLDKVVENVLTLIYKAKDNRDESAVFDLDEQHPLAEKVAEETIVMLKNEGNLLPLSKNSKVAFIGQYAKKPRYQGGGSSHINSYKVTGALEFASDENNITYARGFDDSTDEVNEELINEAIVTASEADVAVIFAGLPDSFESEGYDRTHMKMPESQIRLIDAVCRVQKKVVVVLHNGSPIEMPWINKVSAVLEAYLGGEGVGAAEYKVLFGEVSPSGKLAETFPIKLSDNPSYLYYIGEGNRTEYREGIFVGYRYYEKKDVPVLFPFGHGLSYSEFSYGELKLDKDSIKDTDEVTASIDITNIGDFRAKEVVQLYVRDVESTVIRPEKELKGFVKLDLEPGETKTATFKLDKRSFAYWSSVVHDFIVESGDFTIMVGASSADIRGVAKLNVTSTKEEPVEYTVNTTIGDILKHPRGKEILAPVFEQSTIIEDSTTDAAEKRENGEDPGAVTSQMAEAMMGFFPLHATLGFQKGGLDYPTLYKIVDELNASK